MQRVSRASAVASLPAPPAGGAPGFFTGGNPGAGQPATVPGYEWFNAVQEELLAVILRGGLTASNADLAQVRKSLDRLFGGGLASVSANTTLTVDDAGLVLVNASAGARTITLPAANALGGRPIRFTLVRTDSSANTVTIQRAATDSIEGATSITLDVGERLQIFSDGASDWRFAHARHTQVIASPGWQRLPSGLIMQFGLGTTPQAAGVQQNVTGTISLPIAFPALVVGGPLVTLTDGGATGVSWAGTTLFPGASLTTLTVTGVARDYAPTRGFGFNWLVFGR